MATSASSSPAAAKTSGNSPQTMPSFRLLTSPACVTLESSRSKSVVRQKSPGGGAARPSLAKAPCSSYPQLPLIVQARFAGSLQSVVKNPTKANGLHLVILVPEIGNPENPRLSAAVLPGVLRGLPLERRPVLPIRRVLRRAIEII